MSDRVQVVLGASGGVGSTLVRELAARGQRVRAVNRNGDAEVADGVERMAAPTSPPPPAQRRPRRALRSCITRRSRRTRAGRRTSPP